MRTHLQSIFEAGLERVNPYTMVIDHVQLNDETLTVTLEGSTVSVDLRDYTSIMLLGAGKASAPMAQAFETILGDRISKGLICVKYGHVAPLQHVDIIEAGHPLPDENGVRAAGQIAELAREADDKTLVLTCISGGGSALLPLPLGLELSDGHIALSLDDKQQATAALLRCGADITEINCVRKHISAIKGGRLMQLVTPARSLNFILSDVVGDDLSSIASGVTTYDETTFGDALAIIERYDLGHEVPHGVLRALALGAQGHIPETLKADDPALARVDNLLIGTNRQALLAAAAKARELGYTVHPITAQLTGEARHVARVIADIAKDVATSDMFTKKPACLLFGGETVVTVQGDGTGGRNQEIALAFLAEMSRWGVERERVHFLAASTDGNDGPTDAAGAFADAELLRQIPSLDGTTITKTLNNNDSYHFFAPLGGLLKTGPTNTNVCDLQIVLIV